MAGVKGRSGGPRKNAGGKRSGAGRKPKCIDPSVGQQVPPTPDKEQSESHGIGDSKEFLERVVRGEMIPNAAQLDAAKALLPYQHRKLGETGKKEQKNDEAAKVAGRFSQATAPRLVTFGGKKV